MSSTQRKELKHKRDLDAMRRFYRLCEKKGASIARTKAVLISLGFDQAQVESIIPELSLTAIQAGRSIPSLPQKDKKAKSRSKYKVAARRSGFDFDQTVELQIMPYMNYPTKPAQEVRDVVEMTPILQQHVKRTQRSKGFVYATLGLLLLALAFQLSKPTKARAENHSGISGQVATAK